MKLSPGTIEALQESVRAHWTAIHTYASQAAHFKRWGYPKLSAVMAADVADELGHLAKLHARLELADVAGAVTGGAVAWPRHDVMGILEANLALEAKAVQIERAGVETAREAMDEGTAAVFAANLEGSEDSVAEIEAALRVIEEIGVDNYLANQT